MFARIKPAWLTQDNCLFFLSLFPWILFVGLRIDTDAWFILDCGRYVENYGIPHTEPFLMHEGLHYVMQQWLFGLGLWKIYSFFGIYGLVAYSWIAGIALVAMSAAVLWTVSRGNKPAVFVATQYAAILIGLAFAKQRPWTFSCFLFLVEVFLLEKFRLRRPKWMVAALFFVSALSVNAQAAMWPMLIVLILPYFAEALFGKRLSRFIPCEEGWNLKELSVLLSAIVAGGFVNPYGFEAMRYGFITYGVHSISSVVGEMRPLADLPMVAVIVMPAIVFLVAFHARRPAPLRLLLLSAGTAFMAFIAVRNVLFFLLFGFLGFAWALKDWNPKLPPFHKSSAMAAACSAGVLAAMEPERVAAAFSEHPVMGVLMLFPPGILAFAFRKDRMFSMFSCIVLVMALMSFMWKEVNFPVTPSIDKTTQVVAEDDPDARLVAGFAESNYARFKYGITCWYDSRADALIEPANGKKDYMAEMNALRDGSMYYGDFFDEYPEITHVIARDTDLLSNYLVHDDRFELIYDSSPDFGDEVYKYKVFRLKKKEG